VRGRAGGFRGSSRRRPSVAVLVRVEADGREDAAAVQDAEMTRAAVATAAADARHCDATVASLRARGCSGSVTAGE
jgi:hypothetical protein